MRRSTRGRGSRRRLRAELDRSEGRARRRASSILSRRLRGALRAVAIRSRRSSRRSTSRAARGSRARRPCVVRVVQARARGLHPSHARRRHRDGARGRGSRAVPRSPLLRGRARVSTTIKIRGEVEKWALREAMKDALSAEVVERRKHPLLAPPLAAFGEARSARASPLERASVVLRRGRRGVDARAPRTGAVARALALGSTAHARPHGDDPRAPLRAGHERPRCRSFAARSSAAPRATRRVRSPRSRPARGEAFECEIGRFVRFTNVTTRRHRGVPASPDPRRGPARAPRAPRSRTTRRPAPRRGARVRARVLSRLRSRSTCRASASSPRARTTTRRGACVLHAS